MKPLNNINTFNGCMSKEDLNVLPDLQGRLTDLELICYNNLQTCKFYNYFKKKRLEKEIIDIKIKRKQYKLKIIELRRKND